MPTLKEIDEAAERCQAAWDAVPDATDGQHIHHERYIEPVTEPISNRIAFIRTEKPLEEQVVRLDAMRPLPPKASAEFRPRWDALDAEFRQRWGALDAEFRPRQGALALDDEFRPRWDALDDEFRPRWDALDAEFHARYCTPDCPWDGTTLFPELAR